VSDEGNKMADNVKAAITPAQQWLAWVRYLATVFTFSSIALLAGVDPLNAAAVGITGAVGWGCSAGSLMVGIAIMAMVAESGGKKR